LKNSTGFFVNQRDSFTDLLSGEFFLSTNFVAIFILYRFKLNERFFLGTAIFKLIKKN